MKKVLLITSIVFFLTACSSVKKTQKAINIGNYDSAINIAINKLKNNKTRKGNQVYIYQLEEAFSRVTQRDLDQIAFLKKENNPAHLETIYNAYLKLNNRQERIKPLLPLYLIEENKEASFRFNDYSDAIVDTKVKLSDYLYGDALALMQNTNDKYKYKEAYKQLKYLNQINPGYKDVSQKMEEAHEKGIDYVKVALYNDTETIIPQRLEREMLNMNTYGINDFWTVYHSSPEKDIDYDYEMDLSFNAILISPEQVREREIIKEKRIKDGWEYLFDENDNVVKDSLGNKIKVDKFKKIYCTLYEFTQFKSAEVAAVVTYKDLKQKAVLNSYPISSEFVFEHRYADYKGDKRAIDNDFLPLLDVNAIVFPTNEQMVYDAGEDLKQRLKSIIRKYKFD